MSGSVEAVPHRWVVLAVAPPGSGWLRALAAWAAAGALPVELIRCPTISHLRAELGSTRPSSVALVDADAPGVDRDLLATVGAVLPAVVVDGDAGRLERWPAMGAAAALPADAGAAAVLDLLIAVAPSAVRTPGIPGDPVETRSAFGHGLLVAVCGSGGTGATTVAMALAQGAAAGDALPGPVLLADLCRRADLAMLHDARGSVAGLQELVDLHRADRPLQAEVRAHCRPVATRGYDLLTGLRSPRAWTALRPRAIDAAIASLRAAYATVVADVEGEAEGEPETGSIDVEERHALTRVTLALADVVVVVGGPGVTGTHNLVRLVHELVDAGTSPSRVLPVVNRAPRRAPGRAELTEAVAVLCATPDGRPAPPLLLPPHDLDRCERSGVALPVALCAAVSTAVAAVLGRLPAVPEIARPHASLVPAGAPRLVRPGSLGLADDEV